MDSLPPEILAQIIDTLEFDGHLAQYATISRAWKASIERLTFQRINITSDELEGFAALFEGNNISRQACLAHLLVDFILPLPPNADGCCVVTSPPDREADSAEFSAAVFNLFTILADIDARAIEKRRFSLSFQNAWRRSKPPAEGQRLPWRRCKFQSRLVPGRHPERQIRKAEARSGQFELLHADKLPTLRGVTTLDYSEFYDLDKLKFTGVPQLVARLPGIDILRLRSTDQYRYGRLKRIQHTECLYFGHCCCFLR
jgi:hypothetical protein